MKFPIYGKTKMFQTTNQNLSSTNSAMIETFLGLRYMWLVSFTSYHQVSWWPYLITCGCVVDDFKLHVSPSMNLPQQWNMVHKKGNTFAQYSGEIVQSCLVSLIFTMFVLSCCNARICNKRTILFLHPQASLPSLSCCVFAQTGTHSPTSAG